MELYARWRIRLSIGVKGWRRAFVGISADFSAIIVYFVFIVLEFNVTFLLRKENYSLEILLIIINYSNAYISQLTIIISQNFVNSSICEFILMIFLNNNIL